MHEGGCDKGLVRTVSVWGLAASIINSVVGAGIFAVPAALAASIGVYAPLAFLICAVSIGSVAICWAEGGSRVPTSGGAYGYIEAAFGPLIGYIAGTLLWIGNLLASGGVTAALADTTASVFPKTWTAPVHIAMTLGVVTIIAIVNLGGAARGAHLIEGATLLKLLPFAVFLIVGAGAFHHSNFVQVGTLSPSGFGRAVILALFALTGMENALSISGEVSHPAKSIPRALVMALIPITLLYIAIQLTAQGILGPSLAHSEAPLADAMAAVNPALRVLVLAGTAVSMFGFLSSDILSTPRMLFAFAREGSMPHALGRVHPRTHVPHIAILSYVALVIAISISGTFAELAVLSTLAAAALYILGSAAAWRLARRGVAQAGPPLKFKYLGTATVIAVASIAIIIALASRAEILGLLALIALSALTWFALSTLRRASGPVVGAKPEPE